MPEDNDDRPFVPTDPPERPFEPPLQWPPEPSTPDPAPVSLSDERRIRIWLSEREYGDPRPLDLGETYQLNFRVGSQVQGNLAEGVTTVPSSDVPPLGLKTDWVVTSNQLEFSSTDPEISVVSREIGATVIWVAKFFLLIPYKGESAIRGLQIIPKAAGSAQLNVEIFVKHQLYREVAARLAISKTSTRAATRPISVTTDQSSAPLGQMGLRPTHEWTTPPGQLTIMCCPGQRATVSGDDGQQPVSEIVPWTSDLPAAAGTIENVRASADQLRAHAENYFNDIDPNDLATRLAKWQPESNWSALHDRADDTHRRVWDDIKMSAELRTLAINGRRLFQACFLAGSELRTWIEGLTPGHRLNIHLTPKSGETHVALAGVPWGLMYVQDIPPAGQPIDPMGFMGLRFRIGYTAYAPRGRRDLGEFNATHRTYCLYWGNDPRDVTGREAQWQEQQWRTWQNQTFVPSAQQGMTPKDQLLQSIDDPQPTPVSVLYLYCYCDNIGNGNNIELRFGNSIGVADVVTSTELSSRRLQNQPLVFANACATASSKPYYSNELARGFFERECRAFLGTETKVPISLASRFASIFFHFFYRKIDPAPMAAGEAVAQTRLFLWTHYRNIGGLLYTYVNQYDLFMAKDSELRALQT